MMKRIISKLKHKDVLGISNEVVEDGKIRGYVLFVDVDTHNKREVEDIIQNIGDFTGFIMKTRKGYHIIDLRVRSLRILLYDYLDLVYEYGAIDKNHFCVLLRDGRSILRISSQYRDKIIFDDFIMGDARGYKLSRMHFLIYSAISGIDVKKYLDKYDFVGNMIIYEVYKRRRW